ncbi:MAG: hypothetical protein QOI95_36 [Acidimicrobiaceae bacterium]
MKHRAAIEAALDSGLSNARIESTNTKIRLITRVAFGFHSADASSPSHAQPSAANLPSSPAATNPRIRQEDRCLVELSRATEACRPCGAIQSSRSFSAWYKPSISEASLYRYADTRRVSPPASVETKGCAHM